MNIKNPKLLIACILLCEAAGILGSLFTFSSIPTWYKTLVKPDFSPPNWIFGPVWTTLYALMGASLYLIILKVKNNKKAVAIFLLHLLLNTLWSIVFFGLKDITRALAVIVVLWIMILYIIISFAKIDKKAAIILLPYLAWVSFATLLNYSLWRLN
ncbi:MAG TPA: TspO/MBR family protein [Patescibacteria group bacterium]